MAGCHVDGYDGVGHVRALVVHRRLRRVLQLGVERGVDGQSAFEQVGIRASVGVVLVEQQRTHVAGEKGIGVDAVGWCVGRRVQPQLLGLGIVVLLLRDVAGRQHAVEHHVAARQAGVRVHLGIKIGGRLRDAYERGGLRERQVERRHLEVVLRGRFDAVAAVPVVDDVQVLDQDVVFAEAFLQIDGQLGLADLALEGDVGRLFGQHGVAHELLGDGGSAFQVAAAQVVDEGARDTGDVHAFVLVETHVLGVDGAFQHVWADLLVRYRIALFQLELRQQRGFVACVHHRFAGCVGEVGVLDAGEVLRPAFHDAEGALNSCVADEAKGCHRDEEAPFHRMGAHFALFSPYFHRSTILP